MDSVISEFQSAFFGGRQITDGIVIINEPMEEAKRRKNERVIFKINFGKAYDSIEWDFLDEMMERLNFSEKWRRWIMECVSTALASILINGSPSGDFKLERGLR